MLQGVMRDGIRTAMASAPAAQAPPTQAPAQTPAQAPAQTDGQASDSDSDDSVRAEDGSIDEEPEDKEIREVNNVSDPQMRELIRLCSLKGDFIAPIKDIKKSFRLSQDGGEEVKDLDTLPFPPGIEGALDELVTKLKKQCTESKQDYIPAFVRSEKQWRLFDKTEPGLAKGASVLNPSFSDLAKGVRNTNPVTLTNRAVSNLESQSIELFKTVSYLDHFQYTSVAILSELKSKITKEATDSNDCLSLLDKVVQLTKRSGDMIDMLYRQNSYSLVGLQLSRRDTLLKALPKGLSREALQGLRCSPFGRNLLFGEDAISKAKEENLKLGENKAQATRLASAIRRVIPATQSGASVNKRKAKSEAQGAPSDKSPKVFTPKFKGKPKSKRGNNKSKPNK